MALASVPQYVALAPIVALAVHKPPVVARALPVLTPEHGIFAVVVVVYPC